LPDQDKIGRKEIEELLQPSVLVFSRLNSAKMYPSIRAFVIVKQKSDIFGQGVDNMEE
jgi:hypothetical protein